MHVRHLGASPRRVRVIHSSCLLRSCLAKSLSLRRPAFRRAARDRQPMTLATVEWLQAAYMVPVDPLRRLSCDSAEVIATLVCVL